MRHTQCKPNNKSSDVSTNLKAVSGASHKCAGGSKRIGSDLRDQGWKKIRSTQSGPTPEATTRKTATAAAAAAASSTTASHSHKANADADKAKKSNPSVVKRSVSFNVKRIHRTNERYKKIASKIYKRRTRNRKTLKRVTKAPDKKEGNEGPPTLCETFSRITTMVAETVINEKESQKSTEGKSKKETAADKVKKDPESSGIGKSKAESSSSGESFRTRKESSGTSTEATKSKKEPVKAAPIRRAKATAVSFRRKPKLDKPAVTKVRKGAKGALMKKSSEKTEISAKPKDEESPPGRGITTRRVSAPTSPDTEEADAKQLTDADKNKSAQQQGNASGSKVPNVFKSTMTTEKSKTEKKPLQASKSTVNTTKRKDQSRMKSESKEKKPKINEGQVQTKKSVDESEKELDKDKSEEDAPQQCSVKRMSNQSKLKKVMRKNNAILLKMNGDNGRGNRNVKKPEGTSSKTAKTAKLGSETDGSNSDELTLNILQKKTKTREKSEPAANSSKVKLEPFSPNEDVKSKAEEKVEVPKKQQQQQQQSNDSKNAKGKKVKVEKDEEEGSGIEKKVLEEMLKKRRSKESESDTDEDLDFGSLLAKKLVKKAESGSSPQMKRKRVEAGTAGGSSSSGGGHSDSDQRARRLRLFGFWSGPKRHRVASLNALAKVHCLYENESKGVMAEIEKMGQILKTDAKMEKKPMKKPDKTEKDGKKDPEDLETEKLDSVVINKRTLRGTPGTRGAGKHWDMFAAEFTTSTSCVSSDESHSDTDASKGRPLPLPPSYRQKMQKKESNDKEEVAKTPKRRRKTEIGLTMDLKDMVVRKRMASLNASAILAASYSSEKRSSRKDSSGTSTEDGLSSPDEGRSDDRFHSADESDNCNAKKSAPAPEEKPRECGSERDDNKRRKSFWKTKVEDLKKAAKEKRNSPSPILADFGVGRDLSTTVLEKEKKDELNDDKVRDRGNGSRRTIGHGRRYADAKRKSKTLSDGGGSNQSEGVSGHSRKNMSKLKRTNSKLREGEEVKNINIEKVSGGEKSDEYEYKSDSDTGQRKLIELRNTGGSNKKVAVIVNQDTDVTITGVYVNSTRSTHHEGFCSIAGMQYRISSTSHTQTEATAVLKTSIASEQTPPPTEPTNCSSPRIHKSYTPLSALSNMQPPAGAPPHPHLPPPPPPHHHHHHHHHCGLVPHRPPPEHYLSHGPPQGPVSPLGRRHGCSSAFSAPHCSSQAPPGRSSSPAGRDDEGFGPLPTHGYFQPAGPLIHHHASNPPTKGHSSSATSLDAASAQTELPGSGSSEEIGESSNRSGGETHPPPPPPPPPTASAHHMGYPRGYPPYQGGYYQSGYYPPPPQSSHYQAPPPAFHHYHHHQDFCYPPGYPPAPYPPPASYRRFLQPAPGYFSSEVTYSSSVAPSSQDHGTQQMVVPGSPSSSYTAPLDPYPPPAPYYAGYSGPGPACYTHPPSSRSLAFIEQTYQSCPCPMQSCPKNVHIGPLTGECKRPGALPLPPVALQLPQEPPGAAGPPSPARGSAGMPPLPSPMSNSARPNCGPLWDGRQTKSTPGATDPGHRDEKIQVKSTRSEVIHSADANVAWHATDLSLKRDDVTIDKHNSADGFAVHVQGLLAISSTELSKIPVWTQSDGMLTCRSLEEGGDLKTEIEKIALDLVDKGVKKRKSSEVGDVEKSKKRKRTEEEMTADDEEEGAVVVTAIAEDVPKKNKRRHDISPDDENTENKVKKVKKKVVTVNRKDENDFESSKRNQKSGGVNHAKPKLLKDRNETVSCDTVSEVIELVIKGQGTNRKKTGEEKKKASGTGETTEALAEDEEEDEGVARVSVRRKSNQEKWTIPRVETSHCPRKSRSCSPSRSSAGSATGIKCRDMGSSSPVRAAKSSTEESKRKVTRHAVRSHSSEKLSQEHSKNSKSHRKNSGGYGGSGGAVTKAKIGASILGKSCQNGYASSKCPKKSRCDGSVVNAKKTLSPRSGISPKWSNGWSWDGESFDAKVYLTNDEAPVLRKCYSAMRHVEGDVIQPKDCILLKAGPRKIDLPFVAKVAALWENPDDGEMMVSLLWYYRPEHTDQGRQPTDQQDEIFASRHKDINSVACIEDKCFVLTYNEYCRYRKKVKRMEEGVAEKNVPVPLLEQPYPRQHRQPPCIMAPDMVFFCRRVYDFRQKRLLKNPT